MAFQKISLKIPIQWKQVSSWNEAAKETSGTVYPIGFVFRAPKTGTLKSVGFQFTVITTAQDLHIQFRDASEVTGNPDDTVDAFRLIPSVDVVAGWYNTGILSDDGTDGGVKKSVTKGDLIAVCFTWPGTVGDIRVVQHQIYTWSASNQGQFPYGRQGVSGGSMTSAFQNGKLRMALEYDGGTFPSIPEMMPMEGLNSSSLALRVNGGAQNEAGMRFQVPFKCKVRGSVWSCSDNDSAIDVRMLKDDGSELMPSFSYAANFSDGGGFWRYFTFPTEVTLEANIWYRHVVRATTTGQDFNVLHIINLNKAAHMEAWGAPIKHEFIQRYQGGAWTEDDTKRAQGISLLISEIDDGT